MMPSNTHLSAGRLGPSDPSEAFGDGSAELSRLREHAARSAKELRQSAERAHKENDQELSAFFERCAASDETRVAEARALLRSRSAPPPAEEATSAAFAAGDGATDADVSPDSQRGKVGTWPAF